MGKLRTDLMRESADAKWKLLRLPVWKDGRYQKRQFCKALYIEKDVWIILRQKYSYPFHIAIDSLCFSKSVGALNHCFIAMTFIWLYNGLSIYPSSSKVKMIGRCVNWKWWFELLQNSLSNRHLKWQRLIIFVTPP